MVKTVMSQLLALQSSLEVEEQEGVQEAETPKVVNLLTLVELAKANRLRQKILSGIQPHQSMRLASKTQTSTQKKSNSPLLSEDELVRSNLLT